MGKASKQRFCPAIGGELRPAECGAGRNSRYDCPADCPHNPLTPGSYDRLLAIEGPLDRKSIGWVARGDPGRNASFAGHLEAAGQGSQGHEMHATIAWHLFFERDASGLSSAQRWERAGFPGLDNDERVLFAAKMKMRVVLFEILQVLDGERTLVTDQLSGDGVRFQVMDRAFAAGAVRFGSLLGWSYPLPHFWRMSGTAIKLSDLGPFTVEEVLGETIGHLGGPAEPEARRRWLAEHFNRIVESITATTNERHRQMYLGLDATWGHAVYELTVPYAECRAVLDAEPNLEPADLEASERAEGFKEVRTWFDDRPEARAQALSTGRPLLGTIQMKEGSWKVEASSGARLDRLRQLFEQRLGSRVRFTRERRDDHAARMAANIPIASDPNSIPPKLLERNDPPAFTISKVSFSPSIDPETLTQTVRENEWRTFPDQPIPALDGHTPREAARDPHLRPRLVKLMKSHVCSVDAENLRKGTASDINPLLRELGLHEIDFPPPPPRQVPAPEDEFDDEENAAPLGAQAFPAGTPAAAGPLLPPLPRGRPLTEAEASERIRASIDAFDLAADALDAIAARGSTLVEDLLQATDDLLSQEAFSIMVTHLIGVWFALVPRGGPPPVLPPDVLRAAIERDLVALGTEEKRSDPDRFLKAHRQPHLAVRAMSGCLGTLSSLPKKMKPDRETGAVMMLILSTVINELDRAVRG